MEESHEYPSDEMAGLVTQTANEELTQLQEVQGFDELGDLRFGIVFGTGTMRKQFDAFGLFGIKMGYYFPESRFSLNVGLQYIPTNFTEETGLSNALDNEMEVALDISGRYYFTPPPGRTAPKARISCAGE